MNTWLVFVSVALCAVTGFVLQRGANEGRSPRYFATLALEHVALVLQVAAIGAALAGLSTVAAAVFGGVGGAWIAADGLVFVFSGLRMKVTLLSAVGELPTLAARLPWKRAVAAVFAVGLGCGLCVPQLAWGAAWTSSWIDLVIMGGLGLLAAALSQPLRRGLPVAAGSAWNLRVIAREAAWLTQFTGGTNSAAATAGASPQDPLAVPRTLVPQNEIATSPDPTRPLMRLSAGFTGPTHFDLRIDAGEKPHVVLIFMESVRAADIGCIDDRYDKSLTPNYDAMAKAGILWTDFWAAGTITSLSMCATLFGLPPPFVQRAHQNSAPEGTMRGLPHIFAEQGYLPAFFCDGPLDWENKRQFHLENGYPLFYAAPSIKEKYPEAPEKVWGFHDEYLMRFHADWLEKQDALGRPTFSTLLTVTNHFPWDPPDDAPEIDIVDNDTMLYRYLRCTAYTDMCLGKYMEELRAKGLDKKTIFIMLGDHGQQINGVDQVRWSGRFTTDGLRVPCMLYAPGRVSAPKVINEVAGQVDILPTLLDIFGFQTSHHAVGTSLRRVCETRKELSIHPWPPGTVGTRFGTFKHVYGLETDMSGLFAMEGDPDARDDISSKHPDVTREHHEEARRMLTFLNKLYAEDRLATDPGKEHLKGHLLLTAPPKIPRSLDDCHKRLKNLMALMNKRTKADARETTLLTLILKTVGLNDAERLEFAQMLYARVHLAEVGEFTDQDNARLKELGDKAVFAPGTPDWEITMVDSVRYLITDEAQGNLRTIKHTVP